MTYGLKVYNLEVEGYHTYYVLSVGALVHNRCEGGSDAGKLDSITNLMKQSSKTADGINITTQLDNITKVISEWILVRMHIQLGLIGIQNILTVLILNKIQITAPSGYVYSKWNYHMIPGNYGDVSYTYPCANDSWKNK